jgi:hypothetical protein
MSRAWAGNLPVPRFHLTGTHNRTLEAGFRPKRHRSRVRVNYPVTKGYAFRFEKELA